MNNRCILLSFFNRVKQIIETILMHFDILWTRQFLQIVLKFFIYLVQFLACSSITSAVWYLVIS